MKMTEYETLSQLCSRDWGKPWYEWENLVWLMVFNVESKEWSVENDKQVDDPVRVCGFHGGVCLIIISCDNTRPNVVRKHCLWSLQVLTCGLLGMVYNIHMTFGRGTRWRRWLRHCSTSRKALGSTPYGVLGIFHFSALCARSISWG